MMLLCLSMIIVDTWAFVCTLWLIVFDVLDTFTFEWLQEDTLWKYISDGDVL